MWACRIAHGVSVLENGTLPVSNSYAITPVEYRSVCGPMSFAIACSGAMYAGVPTVIPACVQDTADLAERELADKWAQRALFHVLHGDVRRPVMLEVVMDRDDVRMAERAR